MQFCRPSCNAMLLECQKKKKRNRKLEFLSINNAFFSESVTVILLILIEFVDRHAPCPWMRRVWRDLHNGFRHSCKDRLAVCSKIGKLHKAWQFWCTPNFLQTARPRRSIDSRSWFIGWRSVSDDTRNKDRWAQMMGKRRNKWMMTWWEMLLYRIYSLRSTTEEVC